MSDDSSRVCPVGLAGGLDNSIRRWIQNPKRILRPYVTEGITALDLGCGPGFFSVAMAQMVGKSGGVIAADLQEGMLRQLSSKVKGTELEERISLHKCEQGRIGVSEAVDFVLCFYMVHEIPTQDVFFREIAAILKPNGRVLVVEPPFHVSKAAFEATIKEAQDAGLTPVERPRAFVSKAVVMKATQ